MVGKVTGTNCTRQYNRVNGKPVLEEAEEDEEEEERG